MSFLTLKKSPWFEKGVLVFLFLSGLFFRVYRQNDLLGFYYDQGRDALKAIDILSFKDWPAIGPTTGLSGIFLGPFWFYLIALFYWLGKGNPAIAASLVGLIDAGAIFLLYLIAKRFFSRKVGFLAAFFWTFSYWLIRSARWFSNPSPLPFFTLILIWGLAEWLINRKQQWLLAVFTGLALSLQLEAASAVFYFPAIIFLLWFFRIKIKNLIREKYFWWGLLILVVSLLPQLAFELKNNFLISRNLWGFFTGKVNTQTGQSWAIPGKKIILQRLTWYHRAFLAQLDPNLRLPKAVALLALIFLFYQFFFSQKKFFQLVFIFWLTPLIFLFFFVGNYGNLYDYYLTGFFPIFILLAAYLFARLPWLVAFLFSFYFVWQNGVLIKNYLVAGVDGPEHISLGNQKQVIDWICRDARQQAFNLDVYVPPVIPYAWDYLWFWYGGKMNCQPTTKEVELLYTIWEVDLPHPKRLSAWLERQSRIGKIEAQARFGGIGVERRKRIEEVKK